jgi:hypothetical protein
MSKYFVSGQSLILTVNHSFNIVFTISIGAY